MGRSWKGRPKKAAVERGHGDVNEPENDAHDDTGGEAIWR